MNAPARSRPLIAVVAGVPLFVEALAAAFQGLADVQAVSAADGELEGLLGALHPNAVVLEDSTDEPSFSVDVPLIHVDLERQRVRSRSERTWVHHDVDLSGEAIRNVVLSAVFEGSEGYAVWPQTADHAEAAAP